MTTIKRLFKAFFITNEYLDSDLLPYKIKLNDEYTLHYSSDLNIESVIKGDCAVHLLGYALNSQKNKPYLSLLTKVINEPITSELDSVNYLNGAFVLIKVSSEGVELFSDAAGFRSPYYSKDLKKVSSHDVLFEEFYDYNKYCDRNSNLDYSRYNEVYKLVPSLKLKVGVDIERIFFKKNEEVPYEEILNHMVFVVNNLNKQIELLPNQIILGLTGGIDSKCSLALTKPLTKDIKTFTYMKDIKKIQNKMAKKIYQFDKDIVNELLDNINLKHEFIDFNMDIVNKEYIDNMFNITGTTFNHPLAKIFEDKFNQNEHDVLQIRSVIFSNTKFDYTVDFKNEEKDYNDVIRYIIDKYFKEEYSNARKQEIIEYFDRTQLDYEHMEAIELLDIVHIDSRMGNWHNQLVKETDTVMDFFNYLNDRKTLSLLMHLPIVIRTHHIFQKDLINKYWSILNFFGNNKKENLYDEYRKQLMQSNIEKYGVKENGNLSMKIESKDKISLTPKVNVKNTQDKNYTFKLQNSQIKEISSNYNKTAGRNYIFVDIVSNQNKTTYDIVDLYDGVQLEQNKTYIITIRFMKKIITKSWVNASKLYLKSSKLE